MFKIKHFVFVVSKFSEKVKINKTNLLWSKAMTTPEDQAIQGVINQIWETYDVDKSGALDKEETKRFVQ